jgi:hypothetical protein
VLTPPGMNRAASSRSCSEEVAIGGDSITA